MKVKVSEADNDTLDMLVALASGRVMRAPVLGTDAEAATKQVPFTMYEVVIIRAPGEADRYEVCPITVTRFGVLPGCLAPSISIRDAAGRMAYASVDMFYFDRAEAELEVQGNIRGWWENDFHPSTDWAQGGPLSEGAELSAGPVYANFRLIHWEAYGHDLRYDDRGEYIDGSDNRQTGPTELIARMRCYVASKLGEEVEVPEELICQS